MNETDTAAAAESDWVPEVVVVTGMSGAGRSTVGNVMEDHAGTSSTTCRSACSRSCCVSG